MVTQIKPKEQKAIQQAQQFLSQNNAAAAKDVLLQYTKNNRPGEYATYYLSMTYAILGELQQAYTLADKLLKKIPNNIEYIKLLGSICHGLFDYDRAITLFERALKINSRDFQTISNLANSQKETQQYEEAEKNYKKSLTIQPNQPDALTNYGLLMQVNARIDDAINMHKKALLLAPEHLAATYNLGYALIEKGDNENALKCYIKVLDADPYHVRTLCDIAHIYLKLKRPENSLPYVQRAIEITPEDEHALLNLGITYRSMNDLDKAEASFNQLLRINPDNQTAKYYLAIMKNDGSITSSPEDYVQELFDGYAETFDDQLISKLQYKTPELIGEMIKKHVDITQKHKIIDLGCGTGLAGIYLKNISDYMIGVDLSSKMLKKARERNIYDELVTSGIEQYLEKIDVQPAVIMAADVFVYIGDLSAIFCLISKSIIDRGVFVFSTEDTSDSEKFILRDSGRFAHNEKYIQKLANTNGFTLIDSQKTIIRYDAGKPIHGQVYLLQK